MEGPQNSAAYRLSHLSFTTKDHLPRSGTPHTMLGPPTSIINQDDVPQTCLWVDLMEVVPQLRSPVTRYV